MKLAKNLKLPGLAKRSEVGKTNNFGALRALMYFFVFFVILLIVHIVKAAPSVKEITQLRPTESYFVSAFSNQQKVLKNVGPKDIVKVFPGIDWSIGSQVEIWRAPVYKIVDGNKTISVPSWGLYVEEVLSDGNIIMGEQDKLDIELDTRVSKDLAISITRVNETEIKESESIDYQTIERKNSGLERGKTKIAQAGKRGKKELTYLVHRENGVEISRQLIKSEIIEAAQNKIIAVGTKIIVLSSESGTSSWTWAGTASRRYNRGTLLRITNLSNGKSVEERVGDYGPKPSTGRILDLNIDVWEKIASADAGTIQVKVEELKG